MMTRDTPLDQEHVAEANRRLYNELGERYRSARESHVRSRLKQVDIRRRVERVVSRIGHRDIVALDGGAGDGYLTGVLAELVGKVVAIDISEVMVERLCSCAAANVDCRCEDLVGHLQCHPDTYDLITLCSVVHHFLDYEGLLLAAGAALRPGGLLWTYNDPAGDGARPDLAFRAIHLGESLGLYWREPRRGWGKLVRRLRGKRGGSDLEQLAECHGHLSSGLLGGVLKVLPEAGLKVLELERVVSARSDWGRKLKSRLSRFRSDFTLLCQRTPRTF